MIPCHSVYLLAAIPQTLYLSGTASAPLSHLRWEGTPADNSRDAKRKKPLSFRSWQDMP